MIYDIKHGTVPAHISANFVQKGLAHLFNIMTSINRVMFNPDWNSLEYFLSSRDTGFSLEMLRQMDANAMIGHLSFKQASTITRMAIQVQR